ncbi:hypothetical protein Tco_1008531, partial [Tanacetum coccineum]
VMGFWGRVYESDGETGHIGFNGIWFRVKVLRLRISVFKEEDDERWVSDPSRRHYQDLPISTVDSESVDRQKKSLTTGLDTERGRRRNPISRRSGKAATAINTNDHQHKKETREIDSQLHGDLNRGRRRAADSRCIAQNHINTEMNESRTGRQQIADRCIAHNHINTEMNESRTADSDSSKFRQQQQIQTDRPGITNQTIPDVERGKTRRMQSQM